MAIENADTRFGLRPVKHLNGNPWNGQTVRCYLPSTDANAMFIGDAVDLAGSADAAGVCPTIVKATAGDGNAIAGVITAFDPDPDNLSLVYRPLSTNRYCYVCMDPDVIFEIQACSGAVLANTTVGLNAVLIFSHAGSTATGLSGMEMDSGASDAPAADASNQLLIMGLVDRPDNHISAVNAKWEVLINLHRLRATGDSGNYSGALGV